MRDGLPGWSFDGNVDRPTFNPSIRIRSFDGDQVVECCHYFVRAGRIEFCPDSTHGLAGQKVDMPDIPN